MSKTKKFLCIALTVVLLLNTAAFDSSAVLGDGSALSVDIKLEVGTGNGYGWTPLREDLALKANDVITVRICPESDFLCGVSRYVVMFSNTYFQIVGSDSSAFKANEYNEFYSQVCSGYTGTTSIPQSAWPASMVADGSYAANTAVAVNNQANSFSGNGGYPGYLPGEWLFSFDLKVTQDITDAQARIWMDSRWLRTPANTGGAMFFVKCENPDQLSASGSSVDYFFDLDLIDADIEMPSIFHIIWWAAGGTWWDNSTDNKTTTVHYGEMPLEPGLLIRMGYNFAGWSPQISIATGNMSYFAQWTPDTAYSITWKPNGGTWWDSGTAKKTTIAHYGVTPAPPGQLTKTGSTFAGWSPAVAPATGDTTYTAQWTVNQSTITFNSNNGSAVAAITADAGSVVSAPVNPTKTGFRFDGWFYDISFLNRVVWPLTMPADSITLYAKWTLIPQTSYFDPNNGTALIPINADANAEVYPIADPVYEGHTFQGWFYDDETFLNPVQWPMIMPEISITLYAKWAPLSVTVTFDANGGVGGIISELEYGEPLTPPAVTRPGFIFTGWSPEVPATVPSADTTYTAQWSVSTYTITWDANNGTDATTTIVPYDIIPVPPEVSRPGFIFIGWSPDIVAATGDATYTARWVNRLDFVCIIFDANGGSGGTDYCGYSGDPLNPPVVTRPGYTFTGWSPAVPATMPAADTTYTAQWAINQSTITFESNGGTYIAPITGDIGSSVTAPANPTKEGFIFDGWEPALPSTFPSNDTTVIAMWSIIPFPDDVTITFDPAPGHWPNGSSAPLTFIYEDDGSIFNYPTVPDPIRDGYTFIGWSPSVPATLPAGDLTVTAQWQVNNYAVTFDANGGTGSAEPVTQNYGTEVTLPATGFTKTGYTFIGWNTDPNAATAIENFTVPAEDVTLYAIYRANTYIAVFMVDGETYASFSIDYGAQIPRLVDPEKPGYTFTGWSPEVPDTMPAADTTYVAQWTFTSEPRYWIVLDLLNDGSILFWTLAAIGDSVDAPNWTPTRTGYYFRGWYLDPACTNPVFWPYIMGSTETSTFYAKWSVRSYTITFDANGGTGGTSASMEYGSTLTAPTVSRTGYTFLGWSQEVPETVPAKNTTYTAQWQVNRHTITFNANGGAGSAEPVMQDYGTEVTLPATGFTKTGYTFIGWNTDPNAATALENFTVPAEDVTLYAVYRVNTYNAIFYVSGQVYATVPTVYGAQIVPPADPVREGYTFTGWDGMPETMPANDVTIDATFSITRYYFYFYVRGMLFEIREMYTFKLIFHDDTASPVAIPGYTFTGWDGEIRPVGHDVILNALLEKNSYTIYFDANGGESDERQTVAYGETPVAPAVTREGYTFAGWIPELVPVTCDSTYFALWTVNSYTVTFHANGGTGSAEPVTQDYGTEVTLPATGFTKTGYTFIGWNTDPNAATALESFTVPAEDVTLYAIYRVNTYNAIFRVDGVNYVIVPTVYGAAIQAPANPTKSGYKFSHWSPMPGTMGAGDMIFYAVFDYYYVIFNPNGGRWQNGSTEPIKIINGIFNPANTPQSPVRDGYTFARWSPAIGFHIPPGSDFTFTAQWTRIPVTLGTQSGSTAIIDTAAHTIYGLEEGMTESDFINNQIAVSSGGSLNITLVNGCFGTGTKVELIDNETGQVLETYYIVIFGDVDGDGRITAADANETGMAASYRTAFEEGSPFMAAADVTGDGIVDAFDLNIIRAAALGFGAIDQVNPRNHT